MKSLIALSCLIGFATTHALKVAAAEKPNVVFILTDDQSWDSFGFMGGNCSWGHV